MNTTLLIMAAGLGSRYGGNKQIDRIGPNGEILMEYSIHDAIEAGFDKVVFVIRKSMDELFREMIGNKIAGKVQVEYAYQEYDSLPGGFQAPADRTKPYARCTRCCARGTRFTSPSQSSTRTTITARTPSRPWRAACTGCREPREKRPWWPTT